MSRNTCNSENGEKWPGGWRFKLDGKSGPLKSGALAILAKTTNLAKNGEKSPDPFGEIGDFGENGKIWQKLQILAQTAKNRQRAGNIQNVANIRIGSQEWPLQIDN